MNRDQKIKWGIIGCGDVCEVKSGPAFNMIEHSSLVAVMRRDAARAKDFALRHGVPRWYDKAEAILHDPEISAVYVATPPAFHEEYTLAAMRAGKHVYVEKPVAPDVHACERMITASQKYDVKVSVAHYRRALPLFTEIRNQLASGVIGRPLTIRCTTLQAPTDKWREPEYWRTTPELSGGGLFFDLAPHQLDIFYWLFGSPLQFRGFSSNQRNLYSAADFTTVQALFPDGIYLQGMWAFNVDASCNEDTCEITGDRGKLVFSFFKPSTLNIITMERTESRTLEFPHHIQHPMINEVVRYFRGERDNPCSLQDAWVTLRVMESTRTEKLQ